jgi:hypothetical protein
MIRCPRNEGGNNRPHSFGGTSWSRRGWAACRNIFPLRRRRTRSGRSRLHDCLSERAGPAPTCRWYTARYMAPAEAPIRFCCAHTDRGQSGPRSCSCACPGSGSSASNRSILREAEGSEEINSFHGCSSSLRNAEPRKRGNSEKL